MIRINQDAIKCSTVKYGSVQEVFDLLETHLLPLRNSTNSSDIKLHNEAKEHMHYFRNKLGLKDLDKPYKEINNWQFLHLLATMWRENNLAHNDSVTPMDLSHRLGLEEVGMRVMNKYDICYTTLFKGQTVYSIFGFNPLRLTSTLERVLISENRLCDIAG